MRGSVVKRGPRYYAVIDQGRDENGKRKQKWISNKEWKTKKQVEAALPQLLLDNQKNKLVTGGKEYLFEYLDNWLESAAINLRPNTVQMYRSAIVRVKKYINNCKLSEIQTIHVQKLINAINKDFSSGTVRATFSMFGSAMEQAVTWNMISDTPCRKIILPPKTRKITSIYDQDQLKLLLEFALSNDGYLPVALAITTGMRRSEIAALRWVDINYAEKSIYVTNSLGTTPDTLRQLQPVKTKSSRRIVMIPDVLLDIFRDLQQHSKNDFIIVNPFGKPYKPNSFSQMLNRATRKLGLPHTRFHDLRHAHATYLIMSNVPIKTISERLGHSSTAFTQDVYGHVLRPMQEQAANAVLSLLENVVRENP